MGFKLYQISSQNVCLSLLFVKSLWTELLISIDAMLFSLISFGRLLSRVGRGIDVLLSGGSSLSNNFLFPAINVDDNWLQSVYEFTSPQRWNEGGNGPQI